MRVTDGWTDGQTDGQNHDPQDRASIVASRGKNHNQLLKTSALCPLSVSIYIWLCIHDWHKIQQITHVATK